MAFDFAWNFRATLGYVTDPAYSVFEGGTAGPNVYTNGNGVSVTAGWETGISGSTRNRVNTNDPRIAGIIFAPNITGGTAGHTFTITLPSTGLYNIALAAGDGTTAQNQWINLQDNGVEFADFESIATASNNFMDATGTVYSAANWPANNTTISHVFTSTTMQLRLTPTDTTSTTLSTTIAHLRLTLVGVVDEDNWPTSCIAPIPYDAPICVW